MIKTRARLISLATASAAALSLAASPALAGAFGLREQGTTGQGMSFAGVASGSGALSSIYWNPATITMQPGWQSYIGGSYIDLDARITPTLGTSPLLGNAPSGNLGEAAVVPSTYASYQFNEYLWVGLASNAPFRPCDKAELQLGRSDLRAHVAHLLG